MKAGKELDMKVAEFMGWHPWTNYGKGDDYDGEYPMFMIDDIFIYMFEDDSMPPMIFSPSTDIASALPVLEKAKKSFFSTTITMWDYTDKVVIAGDTRQGHNENISVLFVQAETLPLAICKFALRTKENKNE